MKGRRRRYALLGILGAISLIVPIGLMASPAAAAPSVTVTPNTNLTNGQAVSVSGSGFANSSTGAVLECNSDTSQPTVSALGNNIPVSCTNPLSGITSTSATGTFSATFHIVGGTTGPPATGTDSSGGDAATDAAKYPCPPTPAQQAAGVTCVIAFGDLAGNQATAPITFAGQATTTTSSSATSSSSTSTTKSSTTSSSTSSTTASTSTTSTTATTLPTTTTTKSSTTTSSTTPTTLPTTSTSVSSSTSTSIPCKPGHGYGDMNHCHCGPPGQNKHMGWWMWGHGDHHGDDMGMCTPAPEGHHDFFAHDFFASFLFRLFSCFFGRF